MLTTEQAGQLLEKNKAEILASLVGDQTSFLANTPVLSWNGFSFPYVRVLEGTAGRYVGVNETSLPQGSPNFQGDEIPLKQYIAEIAIDRTLIKRDTGGMLTMATAKSQMAADSLNMTKILIRYGSVTMVTPLTANAHNPISLYYMMAVEQERLYGTNYEVVTTANVTASAAERDRAVSFSIDYLPNGLAVDPTNATHRGQLLEALRKLIMGFPERPDYLYMPYAIWTLLNAVIEKDGSFASLSKSEYSRAIAEWNGVPIVLSDRDSANREIIGMDEKQGTLTETGSVLAIRNGVGNGLVLVVGEESQIEFVTENMESKNSSLWRLNAFHALVNYNPRSVRRLAGVKRA